MKELKEIDCNCNDCKFLIRDSNRFNQSKEFQKNMQLDEFENKKAKLDIQVNEAYRKNEIEGGFSMEQMYRKMKFQFNAKDYCLISFGFCDKKNIDVSFIPNNCQLSTQECFEIRT